MTEVPAETLSEQMASLVAEWWRDGRPAGSTAYVVAPHGADAAVILHRIHRLIEGSVLVDASGLTAEEVLQEALVALGVDLSEGRRQDWPYTLSELAEDRLVLVANAHRAGKTRRSHQPERLLSTTVAGLACSKVALLTHVTPSGLPDQAQAEVVFQLPELDVTAVPESSALRALALAEPRVVPIPVWSQLVAALTGEPVSEAELTRLLENRPEVLTSHPHGVSFADEGLAEALRRETASEEVTRANRHLVEWLQHASPDFRHSEGWAQSGPVGLYAATGLAMHAVQAGTFEVLLEDGGALANISQTVLLDAAYCALENGVPGNCAAADAIYLWSYGVVPTRQSEWAAWLHLMASARNDHAFASAVADSGVRLPWTTRWTRWRPPGGYHVHYLRNPMIDGVAEVRWAGRPAVAGLRYSKSEVAIWDAETGELLAGPWRGEEIPAGHHADLRWPAPSGEDRSGPRTFRELRSGLPAGRSVHFSLLPCPPLPVGDLVVLGGPGGLFAVQPSTGESISRPGFPGLEPLTGAYAPAGEISPVNAPPPSPADLIELYGEEEIVELEPDELPDGLTHEPTRQLLLEFGLPDMHEGGMGLYPYGDHRMESLEEIPWPKHVDPVEESGPFFQIGFWMGGKLVIDGPTGHVLRIPAESDEEHLAGLPAATSLEKFLTMVALWVTGLRTRETIVGSDDEASLLIQHVLVALLRIDRKGGMAPAWPYIFSNE